MADVVHLYGAGDKAQPISQEKQQLIDDLERFIGDIRAGETNVRHDRVMLVYEDQRNGASYPRGYHAGGLKHQFTVLECTGLLRWVAQTLQETGGINPELE